MAPDLFHPVEERVKIWSGPKRQDWAPDIIPVWNVVYNKLVYQDTLDQVVLISSQVKLLLLLLPLWYSLHIEKSKQRKTRDLLTHFILLLKEANKMPGYPGTSHMCVVEI